MSDLWILCSVKHAHRLRQDPPLSTCIHAASELQALQVGLRVLTRNVERAVLVCHVNKQVHKNVLLKPDVHACVWQLLVPETEAKRGLPNVGIDRTVQLANLFEETIEGANRTTQSQECTMFPATGSTTRMMTHIILFIS